MCTAALFRIAKAWRQPRCPRRDGRTKRRHTLGPSRWLGGKESACQCRRCKKRTFSPWVRKIPHKRGWPPIPVFWTEEPWQVTVHGVTESDRTEWLFLNVYIHMLICIHTYICTLHTYMYNQYVCTYKRLYAYVQCMCQFSSVAQSCSNSLQPHGLQHTRPPCPSPTPRACSNSCPSSLWYPPTISPSVVPFSSCLQSFPASESFPMSQCFASGGQSTGASMMWQELR